MQFDTQIALGSHFNRRAGQSGCAHILNGDHRAGLHQFETGFEQQLFGKRIAHLHRRAFFLGGVVEFR